MERSSDERSLRSGPPKVIHYDEDTVNEAEARKRRMIADANWLASMATPGTNSTMETLHSSGVVEVAGSMQFTGVNPFTTWPPTVGISAPAKPISKEAAAVLRFLASQSPVLQSVDDIWLGADLSRPTAAAACNELIEAGYAHRPNGPNKGAAATETGIAAANKLTTSSS